MVFFTVYGLMKNLKSTVYLINMFYLLYLCVQLLIWLFVPNLLLIV